MKKYDNILTLAASLRQMRSWDDLKTDEELFEAVRKIWIVVKREEDFKEGVAMEELRLVVDELSKSPEKYSDLIEGLGSERKEGLNADSLNPVLREKLLDDLEKQKNIKAEEWLKKLEAKERGGRSPGKDEVARIIRRKQELQAEIQIKLNEERPNLDKKVNERIADGISDRLIVQEAELEAKIGRKSAEQVSKIIADKAIESTKGEVDIGKTETAVVAEISKSDITSMGDKAVLKTITEVTREVLSEGIAREKIGIETEELTSKIEAELGVELSKKSKDELRDLVEKKIEKAVLEVGTLVDDKRVTVNESGEKLGVSIVEDIREITKIESVGEGVNIAAATTSGQIIQWLDQEKPEVIDNFRGRAVEKKIQLELLEDKNNSYEDIREYSKVIREIRYGGGKYSPTEGEVRAIARLENSQGEGGQRFTPGAIRRGVEEAEVITNLLRNPGRVADNISRYDQIRKRLGSQPLQIEGVESVDRVMSYLAKDPGLVKSLDFIKKSVHFKEVVLKKIGGETISKISGGGLLMNQSMDAFVTNSASQLAAFGFKQGLRNIIGGIFSGGVKMATAGATGVGASTAAGTTAAAIGASVGGGPPGWVIGLIIFAGKFLLNLASNLGKKLWGKLKSGIESVFGESAAKFLEGLNIGGGLKETIRKVLPGPLGWIGEKLVDLATLPLVLFSILSTASISTVVAVVVPGLIVGLVVYELFIIAPVLVSITPPPLGKQVCQWVKAGADQTPSGEINCNQGIADQNVAGIVSKEVFVDLANRWVGSGGKNYAEECFNDVVSRSRCMGVNPAFALWVWLHESGASNYDLRPDIEDFGIHGQASAPPRDFNAQINYFLKLSHSNACANLPYWLGWATKYLTGECDPDKPLSADFPDRTGRAFYNQIIGQIGLISTAGLPSVIKTGGGGENCDFGEQTGANLINDVGETKPGYVWVCEDNPNNQTNYGEQAPLTPVDPIYQTDCANSPACAVVEYLGANGITSVSVGNLNQAIAIIRAWSNPPAGFNKETFISYMTANTNSQTFFQCIGFNMAIDPRITFGAASHESWTQTILNGNGNCVPIDPTNAGAGDHILYKVGSWYHIQYISVLRPDGSYIISDANNNARYSGSKQVEGGGLRNVPGTGGIAGYMSSKNSLRVVLRCK